MKMDISNGSHVMKMDTATHTVSTSVLQRDTEITGISGQ